MNSLRLADAWIGAKLFHPPIIWLCQRASITQYAVYRYLWWAAALWMVWSDDHTSKVKTACVVIVALVRTLSAGLSVDRPTRPVGWVRAIFLGCLAIDAFDAAAGRQTAVASCVSDVLILAAEYAATITTIPPRKKRQERRAAGVAEVRA